MNPYDTIVIGSGMGGLTCAALLSRLRGERVLVLERHFKLGGFTHTFSRGSYEWDVGLHYVGEMRKGSASRAVFDYITAGRLEWNKMPDVYDSFHFPNFKFDFRAGKENLRRDLKNAFPEEKSAIDSYFKDVEKTMKWSTRYFLSQTLPHAWSPARSLVAGWSRGPALRTTREYLDMRFKNPDLKALLPSQWGDCGLPPSKSAFAIHALILRHYFEGGYYPVGSSRKIAEGIVPQIEKSGGACLLNRVVERILIQNHRAVGVRCAEIVGGRRTEKEFYARRVISNAGAASTYLKMVPSDYPLDFRQDIRRFPAGVAHVTLYIGLEKDSLKGLGFKGENHWLFNSTDHDDIFARRNEVIDGKVHFCYLSTPSLKDPAAKSDTAEAITLVDCEPFRRWADQPWKKRDEAYSALKAKISDALLAEVEKRFPGFKSKVRYQELSTPLTTELFTGHPDGVIYGIPAIPERYRKSWIGVRTPIENLYLTGADGTGLGITGALMGGVMTTAAVMGMPMGLAKIFRSVMR